MAADTSPTQEVETWALCRCGCTRNRVDAGCPDCGGSRDILRIVEHSRFQAEVEKREEVEGRGRESEHAASRLEKERESLAGELSRLLGPIKQRQGVTHNDAIIAAATQLLVKKEAAESRISTAVEELERWSDEADSEDRSSASLAFYKALQLLRDEGDEQGGADGK